MAMTRCVRRSGAKGLIVGIGLLLTPLTALSQTEKLGIVKYTAPKGMTKLPVGNAVLFSEAAPDRYCTITLYGAAPSTGSPIGDFAREWNSLAAKPMKANPNPPTEMTAADGWTAIAAGSAVESRRGKGFGFLAVISGFGQTVSIFAVFNDPIYMKQVESFIDAIEMDKGVAPANSAAATAPVTLDRWGHIFIPQPTRQLTVADLVGNWGDNPGRISTVYVNRDTGNYAGTDSLAFTSNWTFGANGRYVNDFFEIRNGKKLSDVTGGTFAIAGRLLTITHKDTSKYVIRGWLELPDITILKVAGPWFNDQVIPDKIFTDFSPDSEYMLTKSWVRKK